MKLLTVTGVFSVGCFAAAAAAYLWVDRALGRMKW